MPESTRSGQLGLGRAGDTEKLYRIVDVLGAIASELSKTIPQVALNWVPQRPTVSSVVIGARNQEQLRDNLGAVGWRLSPDHIARLDAATDAKPSYPTWHQRLNPRRNPPPV